MDGKQHAGPANQPQLVTRMQQLLSTLNVEEYEPRVVNQLVDFVYRYVADVLQDADAFSVAAGKSGNQLELDNVMLGIQARSTFSFAQPPDADEMALMAEAVNSKDLAKFPANRVGLLIPTDEKETLTAQNWTVVPPK